MELKDFVSESIIQIAQGILEAREKCLALDIIINPDITTGSNGDYCIPKNPENVSIQRRVHLLEMDIAVTTTGTSEGNVGGGVKLNVFNFGAETKEGTSQSNINRLKFSIPVSWPIHVLEKRPKKIPRSSN